MLRHRMKNEMTAAQFMYFKVVVKAAGFKTHFLEVNDDNKDFEYIVYRADNADLYPINPTRHPGRRDPPGIKSVGQSKPKYIDVTYEEAVQFFQKKIEKQIEEEEK